VLVQDYHLTLVPRQLRELRPDLRVGHFSHTPWAPPEYFRMLPDRLAVDLLLGLLGADRVGFLTRRWAEAFVRQRLAVRKPATVSAEFRALQQFWKWMLREDEVTVNPMVGLEAPTVPEQPVPVLEVEQMRASPPIHFLRRNPS
jgi:trehalose-6-phosphate synthase